jgi:hypothetical protein
VIFFIGVTLIFTSLNSALSVPNGIRFWRMHRANPKAILPLVRKVLATTWFFAAGTWLVFMHAQAA